jgi:hypothetical protein
MGKQPSLLDSPETSKQKIAAFPEVIRIVLHKELYKFLDNWATCSEQISLVYWNNIQLANGLEKKYSCYDLGVSIILFLHQLERNKIVYNKKAGHLKTYTIQHLFQIERGSPNVFLKEILKRAADQCDFSAYSSVISELLLKNAGKDDGKREKYFLDLLEIIGIDHIKSILQYKKQVENGNFGHPQYVPVPGKNTVQLITKSAKEKMQQKILQQISLIVARSSRP